MRNYGDRPVDLQLSILFENDFADLFEVRGAHRERRGTATAKVRGNDQVLLIYHGLDNKVRHTTLNFDQFLAFKMKFRHQSPSHHIRAGRVDTR